MTEQKRKKPKPYFDHRTKKLVYPKRPRSQEDQAMSSPPSPPAEPPSALAPLEAAPQPVEPAKEESQTQTPSAESPVVVTEDTVTTSVAPAVERPPVAIKDDGGGKKSKPDPENLEQFIEYAYSRKGQRLKLESKVEKQIAQNPRLDDAALSRLLSRAASDTLLAVPRQLLLASREVEGFPALRAALASFVLDVMRRHPVFADVGVQGALRNLPEAKPAADALAAVVQFTPKEANSKDSLKGAELQALRRNAANLFVTWLANNRGLNTDELAALLFQVAWQPAARELLDDNARLRALTEVEQSAGVGLACLRFRQQAIEARTSQDQALREASDLRMRLADTDTQRQQAEEQRDALQAELEALRDRTAAEMAELKRKHSEERTHLHHDQEQLGGRLVRRLDDAVETLEVGLSALRNRTPRVEVMVERAELVVDALRAEIKNLREE